MTKKIKIAYILTPVDFGGAEKVCQQFLEHFDKQLFDVTAILFVRPWESSNIFIDLLEKIKLPYKTIPVAKRPSGQGKDYFRIARCFLILNAFLKQGDFDLIQTNGYLADIIGLPLARFHNVPSVSTCHGFIENDRKLQLYNRLDKFLLRYSRKVIAVSEELKGELASSGVDTHKIEVIQNAVHIPQGEENRKKRYLIRERLGFKDDDLVLGYVGRLSEEKGLRYFIESAKLLLESGIPLKIIIVGRGPQEERLKNIVQDVNLQKVVLFLGFTKNVQAHLAAMDIFVLPSLTEGTPMALLEAMAYGVPVVASAVGGVPKVVSHNENGILVPARSAESIFFAVKKLYGDETLLTEITKAGQKTITQRFDIGNWVERMQGLYMSLLSEKEVNNSDSTVKSRRVPQIYDNSC